MSSKSPSRIDPSVAGLASAVYFVQGAISISAVAFPLLLRGKGWSISEISSFAFIVGLPWTLKIVYGAISDVFPIAGLRRKPYILIASLVACLSWMGLALFHETRFSILTFSLAANFAFAITDVVTDALIVEKSDETNAQYYQSLSWGFRAAGAVIGGYLGGWLASRFSYQWVFLATALVASVGFIAGLFVKEDATRVPIPHSPLYPIKEGIRLLFRGDLKWFSLLMIVGTFSASFNTPLFFHFKEKLNFSEGFLGSLVSLAWIGAIAGCLLYTRILGKTSLHRMIRYSVWLNVLNILITFLYFDRISAVSITLLGGVIGYLSFLPLISTATVLSRQKGIEGALFALLMSVHNMGQLAAIFVGGQLFDIIGLAPLILLSAVIALSGLFFIDRIKIIQHGTP